MKSRTLFFAFLLLSVFATAQSEYKAAHEGWLVKVDEAYALSQKTGKPILANFTGSDWCGWCKRLSAAVFDKPDFKAWAKENVVLLELDFPRFKKLPVEIQQQNQSLQQAFQVRGYPTVWVFNLKMNEENSGFLIEALGQTGYTATVKQFTADVNQMLARAGNEGE